MDTISPFRMQYEIAPGTPSGQELGFAGETSKARTVADSAGDAQS